MRRVMWIEQKLGDGLVGPARIGWVKVLDKGKRLEYGGQGFRTLRGGGFKSNYYDMQTHEEYWISGCRKDGRDALYNTTVEIDEDALEEYWVNIRKQPENRSVRQMSATGKY
jgi:hypothetical protein